MYCENSVLVVLKKCIRNVLGNLLHEVLGKMFWKNCIRKMYCENPIHEVLQNKYWKMYWENPVLEVL